MRGGRCPLAPPLKTLLGETLQDHLPGEVGAVYTLYSTSKHSYIFCFRVVCPFIHVHVCMS